MGLGQSKGQKNIIDVVEQIAYKLISKQSWKDMQKMESKAECDKLIVITPFEAPLQVTSTTELVTDGLVGCVNVILDVIKQPVVLYSKVSLPMLVF